MKTELEKRLFDKHKEALNRRYVTNDEILEFRKDLIVLELEKQKN